MFLLYHYVILFIYPEILITFVVPANARTTFDPVNINPGIINANPDSPVKVISIFSAFVTPPNSIVNFTEDTDVLTA